MESSPHGTNSRLSCFFCLRSNSRKYLNPQDESDSCVNAEEAVSSFHEFSLRNLYRYLNLLHSDKEEKDFRDLKMPICEDCCRLTTEFNELYYLLEEIKLRLNWCIHKMQEVMTKTKTKAENEVKAAEIEEDDGNKILELWRWRTHTLDRMKAFNHASFPRVLLHKNKRKRLYPGIKIKEEEETQTKIQKEDEKIKLVWGIKTKDQNELRWPSLVEQSHPRPSLFPDQHPFEEDDDDQHQHQAPSLSKIQTFPGNFELDIQMKCDVTETFMQIPSLDGDGTEEVYVVPDSKYEDVTNAEGENEIETQKERKVRPFRAEGRPAVISKFKNKNPSLYRSRTKLTSCPYCHFKCTSAVGSSSASGSMLSHLVRFHPEHYLIDEKDKAEGLWHEQFQTIIKNMVFPNFIRNVGPHRSCKPCGRTYKSYCIGVNSTMLKRHLIFCHKFELKEKLRDILADPLLELEGKLKEMKSQRSSSSLRPIRSSKCSYCRFQCSSKNTRYSMSRHLARFHPDQFLINEERNPSENLRHPQIQRILTDMIFPKFILTIGQHTECSMCKKKFINCQKYENIVSARIHVMRKHKMEFRESIKAVVEDAMLEKTLQASNAYGVTCSCGVYILKSEAFTLSYHQNYCIDIDVANARKSPEKVNSEDNNNDGDEN